jgi:DNA-binding MarR family transcriptional regulator
MSDRHGKAIPRLTATNPDISGERRPLSAADILAHPDFPSARRLHIDDMLELFSDKSLNRMIVEQARLFVSGLLMGLYASYREDDRQTWPTASRIAEHMTRLQFATSRRANAMITRLIDTGYVTKEPSKTDGRVQVLTPTRKLLDYDRAYLRALYRPLALLFPDRGYRPAIDSDPQFHLAWRRVVFRHLNLPASFFKRHPAIEIFTHRDSGYTILLMALRTEIEGMPAQRKLRTFSGIATHLGVSRTHVRNLLLEAQAANLLNTERRGGGDYVLLPALWQAYDGYVADQSANMDAIARLAGAS